MGRRRRGGGRGWSGAIAVSSAAASRSASASACWRASSSAQAYVFQQRRIWRASASARTRGAALASRGRWRRRARPTLRAARKGGRCPARPRAETPPAPLRHGQVPPVQYDRNLTRATDIARRAPLRRQRPPARAAKTQKGGPARGRDARRPRPDSAFERPIRLPEGDLLTGTTSSPPTSNTSGAYSPSGPNSTCSRATVASSQRGERASYRRAHRRPSRSDPRTVPPRTPARPRDSCCSSLTRCGALEPPRRR